MSNLVKIARARATDIPQTHWEGCERDHRECLIQRMADEIDLLRSERDDLRDILLRKGFVECDIPACNCGSWHHRYGLPERMQEIKDALAEAGHELSNANGNLTFNALKELVAERDRLRAALISAMEIVQEDRAGFALANIWPDGRMDNDDGVVLSRYDAVIAQADAALGGER